MFKHEAHRYGSEFLSAPAPRLVSRKSLVGRTLPRPAILALLISLACLTTDPIGASQGGYKSYLDPAGRFAIDYPATMTLKAQGPDWVNIFHPKATLRINVFVEKRPKPRKPDLKPLFTALVKRLSHDMKDVSVLEEGKVPGRIGPQGYAIFSFRNSKNVKLTQLVHYYVTRERTLQLIISDRPEGFKNLEHVIRKVHKSLRIINPALK